jgi:hypothetical protein
MLAGIFVREVLFRRLGMITSVLVPLYLLPTGVADLLDARWLGAATHDFPLAILCLVASLVFYTDSHFVLRRWPELFEQSVDRLAMRQFSYLGGLLLFAGAWAAFPQQAMPLAWTILATALLFAASRFAFEQLAFQAHFYFCAALIATLVTNLPNPAAWHHSSERVATVPLIAALFYAAARWSSAGLKAWESLSEALPAVYRSVGSLLLILLAFYALRPVSVSPAWLFLALVLIEAGFMVKLTDVRIQGYVSLLLAFIGIFFVNLNADAATGGVSPRLYSVLPLILALYYVYGSLEGTPALPRLERRFQIPEASAWCGAIALAALLRFELSIDWVAAAWALCAFLLLGIALKFGRPLFVQQAIAFAFIGAFRAALHNLYERTYLPGPFWYSRGFCTAVTAALLFSSLWFAFKLRDRGTMSSASAFDIVRIVTRKPEQVFSFLGLGLTVALLAVEMRGGLITVSWSALGVLTFLFALAVGERSFRLAGMALLLLGVGKITLVDVWSLNARDRYLAFLSMGSALLLVSFLYSRYRETIRRYL